MIEGLLLFGGALVVSMFDHPKMSAEERKERFYLLFDIHRAEETKLKVFEVLLWYVYFLAPLFLFGRILPAYPLLDDRLYFGLAYALPVCFLATYLIPVFKDLRRYPLIMNVLGRIGCCIPAVALIFSFMVIVNCAGDSSSETRTVVCLAKRASRGSHPSYYIQTTPWSDSSTTVEVDVPESVFSETPSGGQFQITTGKGKLGIEWIRRFDAVRSTSEVPTREGR
jgi:hypothetical protein